MYNYNAQNIGYGKILFLLEDLSKLTTEGVIRVGNYVYEPIEITKLKAKVELELEQRQYF